MHGQAVLIRRHSEELDRREEEIEHAEAAVENGIPIATVATTTMKAHGERQFG